MEQNEHNVEQVKQPKTWDQAFSELKSFIIKSRKEEADKAEKEAAIERTEK